MYADSTLPDSHLLRCRAAASYLVPPGGAIAGRSATVLWGAGLAEAADPVEIVAPYQEPARSIGGLVVHVADLPDDEVERIRGVRVTCPVRTCWDLAQWLPAQEAVVLVDRMLALDRVTLAQLTSYGEQRSGQRGSRRFARVLTLVDGRTESPQESRLRVRLVLAGLPRPVAQFNVYGRLGFVARVDLAWPELKIAIEYDGLWHVGSAAQMDQDRRRLNRLVALGWTVIHVTAARLRNDFEGLVAEIRMAMRRQGTLRV